MKQPTESQIQARAIKYAESRGIVAIRLVFRPGLRAGWPDVLFLLPGGTSLFIEFKGPGKKPTKLQGHRLSQLNDMDHYADYCDSFEEAKALIDEALSHA